MSIMPKRGVCFSCGHDHGDGLGTPDLLRVFASGGDKVTALESEIANLRAALSAVSDIAATKHLAALSAQAAAPVDERASSILRELVELRDLKAEYDANPHMHHVGWFAKKLADYNMRWPVAWERAAMQTEEISAALTHQVAVDAPQGWISVQDRLPEWAKRDDTPCVIDGRSVPPTLFSLTVLVALDSGAVRTDKLTTIEGSPPWFDTYRKRVTHWSPLPAGPVAAVDAQGKAS